MIKERLQMYSLIILMGDIHIEFITNEKFLQVQDNMRKFLQVQDNIQCTSTF